MRRFVPLFVYERTERLENSSARVTPFFVYNLITLTGGGFIHGSDTYPCSPVGYSCWHPLYFVPVIAWHFLRKHMDSPTQSFSSRVLGRITLIH
jgi:hypothetical protein